MTVADQIKTLDDKSKSNQAQYDLDRETAKMFELQSKNLDKDEGLTGGNLGYKPRVLKRQSLSILHWVCHLINHLKK